MEPKKNLCAQIPVSLHTRIRQEQEESGKSLSEFMTELLTNYYENGGKAEDGGLSSARGTVRAVQGVSETA